MSELSRAALFCKLSPIAYCAIESGATFGRLRGHARIELAHWLHQVLQANDSDLHRIVNSIELDVGALVRESSEALARLPSGDGRHVDLSCDVLEAAERGWLYASLAYGAQQVRTGHLLVGILETPTLRRALLASMPSLAADRERAGLLETRWRDEARRVDAVLSARAALCEAAPADEHASSEQNVASTENDERRAELARLESDDGAFRCRIER